MTGLRLSTIPINRKSDVDTAPGLDPQRQTVTRSSKPAKASADVNGRAETAQATYTAMLQNFAPPTRLRKSPGQT